MQSISLFFGVDNQFICQCKHVLSESLAEHKEGKVAVIVSIYKHFIFYETNMSEKISLLRRPRPPKIKKVLPPVVSFRNVESNFSREVSGEIQVMTSSNYDGIQSPVPTMQSEYESVKIKPTKPTRLKMMSYPGAEYHGYTLGGPEDTWVWNKRLVRPYRPRGPEPFPIRQSRQPLDVKPEFILPDDSYYHKEPKFSLEDFLLESKEGPRLEPSIKKAILSKANYVKLTKILQHIILRTHDGQFPRVTRVNMTEQYHSLPQKRKKIPKQQILIEMKKAIQERLEELGLTKQQHIESSEKLHEVFEEVQEMGGMNGIGIRSQMSLFNKATENVFSEKKKSAEGLETDESIITPSELAILNCLMEGGFVLSLKAHFISEIPDLSPLRHSLIYLNLSFNELVDFPKDIIHCRNLHVLKFRDNPLVEVPSEICRLRHLRTLILSFCCLTSLPVSLFSLTTLEFLDVSYNKISLLPNEIMNLVNLRFLNLEGNELTGLPCGLLRINLFRIRIRNNFMCPLFWKENSKNSPQKLSDICCLMLQKEFIKKEAENYSKFPPAVAQLLQNYKYCDCCRGPMYGPGLRILRPCTEIWGIRRIPFIFKACSPQCYLNFVENTDPKVAEIIYGMEDEEDERKIHTA